MNDLKEILKRLDRLELENKSLKRLCEVQQTAIAELDDALQAANVRIDSLAETATDLGNDIDGVLTVEGSQ